MQFSRHFDLLRFSQSGSEADDGPCRHAPFARLGHSGQALRTCFTLVEWLCRVANPIDSAGVLGPHHCPGRGIFASHSRGRPALAPIKNIDLDQTQSIISSCIATLLNQQVANNFLA